MSRIEKTLSIAAIVLVQLGLVHADGIVSIGFIIANNVHVPLTEKVSMLLMCVCDPISFILSWFKPKIAGALLAFTAGLTLILSLTASDSHSLKALWLSGGAFWAVKLILSYVFYKKLGLVLGHTAIA